MLILDISPTASFSDSVSVKPPSVLEDLGFKIEREGLYSRYSDEVAQLILDDLIDKIKNEVISTRKKRGQVKDVLSSSSLLAIEEFENKDFKPLNLYHTPTIEESNNPNKEEKSPRRTRRVKSVEVPLFGELLYLKAGVVNNHRDITDLYNYYISNKNNLSPSFPCLIRMSLRLLCETAANDILGNNDLGTYIKTNFALAKKTLSQDQKMLLANQNVKDDTMLQLLYNFLLQNLLTFHFRYHFSGNKHQYLTLGLIPHFYDITFFIDDYSSEKCQCPLGLIPHFYGTPSKT